MVTFPENTLKFLEAIQVLFRCSELFEPEYFFRCVWSFVPPTEDNYIKKKSLKTDLKISAKSLSLKTTILTSFGSHSIVNQYTSTSTFDITMKTFNTKGKTCCSRTVYTHPKNN